MQKEKGNIALVLIIIILVVGLAVAIYLVGQKTNLFPKAYSPKSTKTDSQETSQSQYKNPFSEETSSVSEDNNPFSGYQNPFEELK